MIFGVGTDIVEYSRVQSIWDRFGEHFAKRILMDEEMTLFRRAKDPVRFLAMRFAGKEASVRLTCPLPIPSLSQTR
ncbi:MAG: 4'-phosphopantetheinyl transferase superfamily protein [Pseudomonadota bacterium]